MIATILIPAYVFYPIAIASVGAGLYFVVLFVKDKFGTK